MCEDAHKNDMRNLINNEVMVTAAFALYLCAVTLAASRTELFIAGTDEGLIHLCNTNYSEQYLETYWGHTGPIFRVEWSPFLRDCFLRYI